ncbi:unnamed protein product [Penicillium nalgiovense]|nr:unnamed protein product [Penicillium nalgiovense]
MLFKMSSLALPRSPMEVELTLDQTEPAYTCQDTVSGEVILQTGSPADLSTIFLQLSGAATSRLTQSRRTETHSVCGKIPHVIECYKTGHWSNKPQITCPNIACWPKRKSHQLSKTPPSIGDSKSLAEIKYSLGVVVSGKSAVKKVSNCPLSPAIIQQRIALNSLLIIIKTRYIIFHSFSDPIPNHKPYKQNCFISINPHILDNDSPLSLKIDIELQNGPCLLLGNSIPLSITVTKLGHSRCKILLSAFQTMLVETTQVKAQGTPESSTSTRIVQSMANMNYPIGLEDAPTNSRVSLRDTIWAGSRLPPEITSSFEVCNIKRMYKLSLRLAFLVGQFKVTTFRQSSENSNFLSILWGQPQPQPLNNTLDSRSRRLYGFPFPYSFILFRCLFVHPLFV